MILKGWLLLMKYINKFLLLIIVCAFVCISSLNVIADKENTTFDNSPILSVIKTQEGSSKLDPTLYQKEYYENSLQNFDLEGACILKIYDDSEMLFAGEELDVLLEKSEAVFSKRYVVFKKDDIKILFTEQKDNTHIVGIDGRYDITPRFLTDIAESSIYDSELVSDNTKFSMILCYDDTASHGGASVYYLSDNNGVVWYYETYFSEPVEFTLTEYKKYAVAYYEYISSYDFNYDENGEGKGGGGSFVDFIKRSTEGPINPNNNTNGNANNTVNNDANNNTNGNERGDAALDESNALYIIITAAAMLFLVAILLFVFYKKATKKRQ